MQVPLLDISLEYCAPCGYAPRVIALVNELLSERQLEYYIKSWTLIPGHGGVFEFVVNGELVYSKKSLKRHAEPGEIRALLVEKLMPLIPADATVRPGEPLPGGNGH
jgi:selenoprotein W-related protein